ncbi:MAG: hypothetical protein JWN59_1125 [Sphingomonas bacterium]|nr:hypothetical protein [Sphingomonas bacterium]
MARTPDSLPEGTDSIIPGASASDLADNGGDFGGTSASAPFAGAVDIGSGTGGLSTGVSSTGLGGSPSATSLKDEAAGKAAGLRDQAADKARSFAVQGKDKATEALDSVVRMVDDAAGTIDEKVGEQYGDYVRRASGTLANVASQLRGKDVEDLIADAREVVRKSPAIAIGAAAAVGFLIARVVKAGAPSTTADAPRSTDGPETPAA